MDVLQAATLFGGVIALVGLLRLHRVVVREHLLPEVVDEDEREE